MLLPSYNHYVGKVKRDFVFSFNRVQLGDGTFVSDTSFRTSQYVEAPSTKMAMLLRAPQLDSANIFYYDASKKYLGYAPLRKGIISMNKSCAYYVISFKSDDEAYKSKQDYFAELTLVMPHYKELSKKYAKESQQEFFRISLEGKIFLQCEDYEIINASDIEDSFIFIITKLNRTSNTYTEYYTGKFSKTDCKLNKSKRQCEFNATAIDSYSEILDKYEHTYDLIKLAPAITKIDMFKRSLIQIYIKGASTISNFFGGTYWEADVNTAIDSHDDLVNKYYFSYVQTGNEFRVTGADIADINATYAGTLGVYTQKKGYTVYIKDAQSGTGVGVYYVYIKRNSDNKDLYVSKTQYVIAQREDPYLNSGDIEMIKLGDPTKTCRIIAPFVYSIYRRLLCDVDRTTGGAGSLSTYDLPIDDFVSDNRNYKKCIGLKGGTFFCTVDTVTEPTQFGINDYGEYFTNNFLPSTAGYGRLMPVCRSTWANASLWYVYEPTYKSFEEGLRKRFTLKNSYSIADAISAMLKKIDPAIKHEATSEYSQFLYGSSNPAGGPRFYAFITPKTNILKSEYDQPAQKAEVTFKSLMDMLRDCFRCYWYIDGDKLKIEHISYFMNGGAYSGNPRTQLDLTAQFDVFNKKVLTFFQKEIEYDKSNLISRYEFNWMDDSTEVFSGQTIDVLSNYVQKDLTEEINVDQFSADVDFMMFNPGSFSNDGFALLCPLKVGSTYELPIVEIKGIRDNDTTFDAIIQNYYASWLYLIDFYLTDMPAFSIDVNALPNARARGVKKCMKQSVAFQAEEDPNVLEQIKTSEGYGSVDSISVNIITRTAKTDLVFKPE